MPVFLLVNGKMKVFKKGIGVLPWLGKSQIDYRIVPQIYFKFKVWAGLNAKIGKKGCVSFKVIGDKKVLFDSGVIKGNAPTKNICVGIKGISKLSLLVEERQKEPSDFIYNHSVWAEPELLR